MILYVRGTFFMYCFSSFLSLAGSLTRSFLCSPFPLFSASFFPIRHLLLFDIFCIYAGKFDIDHVQLKSQISITYFSLALTAFPSKNKCHCLRPIDVKTTVSRWILWWIFYIGSTERSTNPLNVNHFHTEKVFELSRYWKYCLHGVFIQSEIFSA